MNDLEPDREFAGYRIESMIGRGGMAVVYRAEDTRLGRKVALKLLSPQLAGSDQFRQRFIRESRLAASLDHPNIVPIYEAGEAEGQLFIAMRYVTGSDLKNVLAEEGGQLPAHRMVRLFAQLGDALDSAHRAGLVHRDVKPGNILIASRDRSRSTGGDHVYLTDFGLTKRTSELSGGLTGTGRFLGTVDYVSPEQIQGRPVGAATDIYALGCVLYECLTGQLPYRRDDDAALLWAHLVEPPPRATLVRPELPDAVDAVVTRAMAKDPADRYGSCEDLVQELDAAFTTLVAPAPPSGEQPGTPPAAEAGTVAGSDAGGDAGTVVGAAAGTAAGSTAGTTAGATVGSGVAFHPAPAPGAVSYSLAIDLGTSFVAAAVADDRGLEMVSLGDGALVSPAVVYARDDGGLLTGEAAARRAVSHPERVAREIKRNLGNPTPVMLGGSPFRVDDLLGALLQDVLSRVTERQGAAPAVVALTHPATWGPFRRQAFEAVARATGVPEPLYTTEPEAAAAYYASTRPLDEGAVLAVYDLGGGTFDATVLRRTGPGFEILGTPEGIERLGGADFDDAIIAHVNYLAGGALGELDLSDAPTVVAMARLRQDCTLAKEALSADAEATIPVFLPNRHFEVTLTRAELESMIRAPIESTIGTLDRVLRAAQVDRDALAAVLLVGGSSKIPLVAEMVTEAFGRPTVVGAHPKHAVALGAALLAERRRAAGPVVADQGAAWSPAGAASSSLAGASTWTTGGVPAGATAATGTGTVLAPAGPAAGAGDPPSPPAPALAPVPAPRSGEPPAGPPPGGAPPARPDEGPPSAGGPPPPGTGGPGPAAGAATDRSRRRWRAVIAGVLVLLVAGAGVLLYLTLRPASRPSSTASSSSAPSPASRTASGSAAPAPPSAPVATAVPIPALGPPIAVGPTPNFVVASPSGHQLYVANRNAGVVTVVDTTAGTVTGTIPIPVGPPQFIAFSPDGHRAYVSVWNDARTIAAVSVLDTTTNAIVATIPMHTRPFLAAVSPDGKRVYVPNHDTGTVVVVDTATNKQVGQFQVPPNPHSIAFTPDGGHVYVADHESNVVSVVQTSDDTVVAQIPVPTSPHNVAVHPTRPLAVVASFDAASVSAIDTTTNKVVATVPVGQQPQHVAWSADGRFAYITNDGSSTLSVLDLSTFTVTATIPTGRSPTSMAVRPDGQDGYVSDLDDGTLTVLHLAG